MSNHNDTSAYYARQREQQLRKILREDFGARRYRISGNEVHAYGEMPNSNVTGWYLLGSRKDVESRYAI